MNALFVARLDRASEALLLLLAFAAPAASLGTAYDVAYVKELTLAAVAAALAALWLLRSLAAGRVELPVSRAGFIAAAAAFVLTGAFRPELVVLFLAALLGPASIAFAGALADALLAAGAVASGAAALARLGLWPWPYEGSPLLGRSELVGAFSAVCLALGAARAADPERSTLPRLAAGGIAALSLVRLAGLPLDLWTGAPRLSPATLLLAAPLLAGLRDGILRLRKGETAEGLLVLGLTAGGAALVVTGLTGSVLNSPVASVPLWLLAGALAGLATERGASRVLAVPFPLPPAGRAALAVPVLAALAYAWSPGITRLRSEWDYNLAIERTRARDIEGAATAFSRVNDVHPAAWRARLLHGRLLEERNHRGDLEASVPLYQQAARLSPGLPFGDLAAGAALRRLGKWPEAAEAYRRAAAAGSAPAWKGLSETLALLGKKEESLQAARAAVRAAPDDPELWRFLSDKYRERKDFKTARRLLDKAARTYDVSGVRR